MFISSPSPVTQKANKEIEADANLFAKSQKRQVI